MSDVSKKWVKEKCSEMFDVNECPEYDLLVNYSNGKLDKDENHQIETHLNKCHLCYTVMENLESVDEKKVDLASDEIMSLLKINNSNSEIISETNRQNKFLNSLWGFVKRKPSIRYSFSAGLSFTLVLVVAYQLIKPDYYDLARLNDQEKEMIMISVENQRGTDLTEQTEEDLSLLLQNEESILGFIPTFNATNINNSLRILNNAYSNTEDSFYKEKYAYFISKLHLMNNDESNAKVWLNKVLDYKSETLYSKYAIQILKNLE